MCDEETGDHRSTTTVLLVGTRPKAEKVETKKILLSKKKYI